MHVEKQKNPVHLALVQKKTKPKSCAFTCSTYKTKPKSYAFATCVQ